MTPMIVLKLSAAERDEVREWLGNLHDGEHYGGGSVIFPDEALILTILGSSSPELAFTVDQAKMLLRLSQGGLGGALHVRIRKALEELPKP